MQYDVGRLVVIDVEDWTRTAAARGAGSRATREESLRQDQEG